MESLMGQFTLFQVPMAKESSLLSGLKSGLILWQQCSGKF